MKMGILIHMLRRKRGIASLRLRGASQKSTKLPRAEVATKPSASEGGNDQKGGEDQQEDVAKLGIKDPANRYNQHDHAQIRGNCPDFGLFHS